jgi:hypothetical protein
MVYRLNRSLAINCEYIGNNMKSLVLWVNSLDMEFLIVEYFICFQTYSKSCYLHEHCLDVGVPEI